MMGVWKDVECTPCGCGCATTLSVRIKEIREFDSQFWGVEKMPA